MNTYLYRMITEEEKAFMSFWERNRDAYAGIFSKLLRGLPMALLFSLPIVLFVVVVKLFFPEWYTKISQTSPATFITTIFAVIIITLFYAVFRMQSKWEHNEEVYQRLKMKEKNTTV